jgi:hypothetical protein
MADENKMPNGFFAGLWQTVSGFFEAQSEKIWNSFNKIFWSIISSITEKLSKQLSDIEIKLWKPQVKAWQQRNWIDEETAQELQSLTSLNFPYNAVAFTIVTITMLITAVKQLAYTTTTDIRRTLFSKYRPEDIQGTSVLSAGFLAPEKIPLIKKILSQNGFPAEQIDLLFIAIQRLYDENTIRTLFYRNVLDEKQVYIKMRQLGYTDERIAEIMKTWPVIPSVNDILTMAVREAFSEDIISKYGYAEEFPEGQISWLLQQGLSEDFIKRYWYAHWQYPSIGQAFEMLHRGIINFTELNDLLRVSDIAPYWRDKLTDMAYVPFTRVDIRRMHQLKVLNDEELILSYMDIGYSQDKAVKMAEFTLALNNEDKTNLSKAEILKGYSEGFIAEDEAVNMLTTLKFNKDEIDYMLNYQDYQDSQKMINKSIATIETEFKNKLIDAFDAKTKLSTMNIKARQTDILINNWQLEMKVDVKLPTKTDLDRFINAGLINKEQYKTELKLIGYEDKYIQLYAGLLKTPKPKEA